MGRTFVADECLQLYLEKLFKSNQWWIGLVVGQLTNQKDYAVQLIKTPEPVEDEASEEEVDPLLEKLEVKSTAKKAKPTRRVKTLDLIDELWVANHARQVTRMLPGGLDVIGVFAVAPPDMMQKSQTKLRQCIFAVQKAVSKCHAVDVEQSITDRLLLQICSVSRKITCRTLDVADIKCTARPAEWKYYSHTDKWTKLTSFVSVDIAVPVPQVSQQQTFLKQTQNSIKLYCQCIMDSLCLVDGEMREETEQLDQSGDSGGSGGKRKGKDKGHSVQHSHVMDFLIQLANNNNVCEGAVTDSIAKMSVRGAICSRAYLNNKCTVKEAIQAIKIDVIRSLTSRCELLCEDLDLVEEDTGRKEVYNTPVRVFCSVPEKSIEFCDYMFQDEKVGEVSERIQELLDIEIDEENLELQCENTAVEEDWASKENDSDSQTNVHSMVSSTANNIKVILGAAVSGIVALCAVGLSYIYTEYS